MDRDRDRNLLFGLLAAQLRRVPAASVASATKAWESDRTRDVSDRLVDDGALSEDERCMLLRLVDRAAVGTDVEPGATLDALGSITWMASGQHNPESSSEGAGADLSFPQSMVEECPGRYSPLGEYSRGGMGRILLVRDEHLAREVALKELLPGRVADRATAGWSAPQPYAARFVQEARITGRLEHPSIVPIYELGRRADGTLYYTMKLVRGQTLSKAIQSAGSLEHRLQLLPHFLDLCHAIAYAHSCGVIHRDIKSANTMVGEFGETVVIDWGLAKSSDRDDIQSELPSCSDDDRIGKSQSGINTTDGKVMGTPVFMAPEQALGQNDKVDERSDIYSLGAVLYELLTGTPPFTGATSHEVIERVRRGEYIPIHVIEPAAPAELVAICARAMQREPARRYQSSKELAEEINRFLSGALVRSYDYRFREHLRRFARRYRAILLTAGAAALLLTGLGVYYNVQLVESRDEARDYARQAGAERDRAEHENYYTQIALAERSVRESQIDQARTTLSNCPTRFRNWEWGRLEQLCNQAYRTLDGHTGGVNAIAMGPAGTPMVTASDDGTCRVWDAERGAAVQTLNGNDGQMLAAAVSPNGALLATAGANGEIQIWNIATGVVSKRLTGHTGPVNALAYRADGHLLASASDDDTARIWDVESGAALVTLQAHLNDVTSVAFNPLGNRVLTGSRDDTAIIWDVQSGAIVRRYTGHRSDVTSVAFSPDGSAAASGGLDATVRIWSPDTGETISTLDEGAPINAVVFGPDGRRVACANAHNTVSVWDWRAPASRLRVIQGHARGVRSVAFFDNGHRLVTGSEDCTAKLWNLDEEIGLLTLHQSLPGGQFVKFAAGIDGKRVVATDARGACVVWNLETDTPVKEFSTESVYAMEFNSVSSRLLTVQTDGSITLWDILGSARISSFSAPLCNVAALSDDGATLAVGERNGTLTLYDSASGAKRFSVQAHRATVSALAFSRDGALLASGGQDNTVVVWDVRSGESKRSHAENYAPEAVTFRPDGAAVAIVGAESVIWTIDDTTPPLQLVANNAKARTMVSATFSPDGDRIAAGSKDGVVTLWDAETAQELLTLPVCQSYVESLTFSPDGTTLAATGWDQKSGDTLVRWSVKDWRNTRPKKPDAHSENFRAYLAEMARRQSHSPAAGAEAEKHQSALSSEEFSQLLRNCSQILKANRDAKLYQGKLFASEGMLIESDDPARLFIFQKLGFAPGDIVTFINGTRILSYDTAIEALRRAELDGLRKLHLDLLRDGAPVSLEFVSANSPS